MRRIKIKQLLTGSSIGKDVTVKGWVKAFRSNRFIALNDGSTINNIQIVVDFENFDEDLLSKVTVAAAISVTGELVESQGSGQKIEIQAKSIEVIGEADPEEIQKTILQPKRHTLERLREQAHLRFRTNTFSAVFRVRHALAYAVHKYFNDSGFVYLHTPIVTGSDAEGAGEMFRVSTLDPENLPKTEGGKIDYSQDFFGKETNLTVSGQLEAELGALAFSEVYTFGPTFRAENSNTTRHLAEFWMIEPEVAFNDLNDNMDLAEDFLKYCINYVLENCADDLTFLETRLADEEKSKPQDQRSEMALIEKLKFITDNEFVRLTYTEAIDILRNSKPNKKKKFKYLIEGWGADLQSEHERYLVEKKFKKPVILTNYPADIKAFYMRQDDELPDAPPGMEVGPTVSAMDILFPGIGEIAGGSQREERYENLLNGIKKFGIEEETVWWYLETRKFGTVPHSGFGLGFERLVLFCTGMGNIRDVIPFPRTPNNAEF
ncbi:MAG: asparagine--tRNA ligase [Flavobacteriales bacterium]|nr:asparagine--tRNA ligase [Flavobacteriales bacterium]